jgi:hypothetical protein
VRAVRPEKASLAILVILFWSRSSRLRAVKLEKGSLSMLGMLLKLRIRIVVLFEMSLGTLVSSSFE